MWYEKYKKISSALFTYENSGQRSGQAPPWKEMCNEEFDIVDIEGSHGMDQMYKIVGYTEQPPFHPQYPSVAIMFEDQTTFEKIWWHFSKE